MLGISAWEFRGLGFEDSGKEHILQGTKKGLTGSESFFVKGP